MIRAGIKEDFDQLIVLCERFWHETEFYKRYKEPFISDQSIVYLNIALDQKLLAVAEENNEIVGFAAGIKVPLMGNPNVFSGTELAWWINPEFRNGKLGSNLFDFVENMAEKAEIKYWCMVSLQSSNPDQVNAFYERKGYQLSEMTYMRCLWPL